MRPYGYRFVKAGQRLSVNFAPAPIALRSRFLSAKRQGGMGTLFGRHPLLAGSGPSAIGPLGPRFDIREFHQRVLENGSTPLTALRANIASWIAAERSAERD